MTTASDAISVIRDQFTFLVTVTAAAYTARTGYRDDTSEEPVPDRYCGDTSPLEAAVEAAARATLSGVASVLVSEDMMTEYQASDLLTRQFEHPRYGHQTAAQIAGAIAHVIEDDQAQSDEVRLVGIRYILTGK